MPSLFTNITATEVLSELLSKADKEMLVNALLSDPTFREKLLAKLASDMPIAKLPTSIDCNQARLILGGISDSTLSRIRKKYPEMIIGGPRSKRYNRDVVLRLAKKRGNAKF